MPPVIKQHPRRWTAALVLFVITLADLLEAAPEVFAWIQQRMGIVLAGLCVIVWLVYMKNQDHDRKDAAVAARLDTLEAEMPPLQRGIRWLITTTAGESGEATANAILGEEKNQSGN